MTVNTGPNRPHNPKSPVPQNNRAQGFTLVELIAVIIILGVLAAVVVPKYFDMTGRAQDATYTAALSEGVTRMNAAYGQYYLDHGAKPANVGTDLAGTDYLSLTSSKCSIGDFQLGFSEPTGTPLTVTITLYSKDGSTVLKYSSGADVTLSCPWPS